MLGLLKRAVDPALIYVTVASLVALVVVTAQAPLGLRLIAATVLVLVPGVGLLRLLLPRNGARGSDQALVVPLATLLGVLVWLGVVLVLNGVGITLGPVSVAVTLTASGLLLAGTAIARNRGVERRGIGLGPYLKRRGRTITAVLTTAVLIGGAAALAVSVIPAPTPVYTTMGFVDDKPFGDGAPVVAANSDVRLNWVVRGFGCVLSQALTSVRLVIDGVPTADVAVDVSPLAAPDVDGSAGTIVGAVTFPAPRKPGRYGVDLFVTPVAQDGTDVPAPGFVSTQLEVRK